MLGKIVHFVDSVEDNKDLWDKQVMHLASNLVTMHQVLDKVDLDKLSVMWVVVNKPLV